MKTKTTSFLAVAMMSAALAAQDAASARAAYQQQVAINEVGRLAQQFDQLSANQEALAQRMGRLEGGNSTADLRAEIAALKAEISALKREQDAMRRDIVAEISRKIATLPMAQGAAAPRGPAPRSSARASGGPRSGAAAPAPEFSGNYYDHEVEKGQTLSMIAEGYGTTVARILSANPGLKPNALRVGQKIKVPEEKKAK